MPGKTSSSFQATPRVCFLRESEGPYDAALSLSFLRCALHFFVQERYFTPPAFWLFCLLRYTVLLKCNQGKLTGPECSYPVFVSVYSWGTSNEDFLFFSLLSGRISTLKDETGAVSIERAVTH